MSNIGSMKGQSYVNYQLAGVGRDAEGSKVQECSFAEATVIGKIINHLNEAISQESKNLSFLQTYSLNKGIKKFGTKGKQAAYEEMKQLHDRVCFKPIDKKTLAAIEFRIRIEQAKDKCSQFYRC